MSTDWLIHLAALAGVGVVVPVAFGGRDRRPWWTALALAVAGAFAPPPWPLLGACALLVVAGVEAALLLRRQLTVARSGGPATRLDNGLRVLAAGYGIVAAAALVQARSGIVLFRVGAPFVELTAVHFAFAGAAALTLARVAAGATPTGQHARRTLAAVAVGATATAPPVVALGFVTGWAIPHVGGAVLMATGVCATAAAQLLESGGERHRPTRLALRLSGLAVWVPMGLAVEWALGQHTAGLAFLPIRWMVRTHGAVNAVLFVAAGLYARRRHLGEAAGGLTYRHVGSTMPTNWSGAVAARPPGAPPVPLGGRRTVERRSALVEGVGAAGFARARAALDAWAPQRAIGARVYPATVASPGNDHRVVLRRGFVRVAVPVRVVAVLDEADRFGVAYGTRAGHPERGEELFLVERQGGDVRLSVVVDAVTAGWYRPLAPAVDAIRRWALERYVRALADAARVPPRAQECAA